MGLGWLQWQAFWAWIQTLSGGQRYLGNLCTLWGTTGWGTMWLACVLHVLQ